MSSGDSKVFFLGVPVLQIFINIGVGEGSPNVTCTQKKKLESHFFVVWCLVLVVG